MKKIILTLLALSFALMAFAQVDITIGTGTSTGRYPLNDYYKYSRSQSLYMESEIGAPGTIHKLRWYRDDTGADPDAIATTQIWLKTVTNAVLTGTDWEDPGTLVAEISNIDLGAGGGWYEVDITDFAYSGGNLLVSVYTQNAPYTDPHAYWRYTATTGFNRCRLGNSDSSNPPTLSLSTARPNIQINMTAGAPSVAPNPAILAAPMNGGYALAGDILSWNNGGGFPATYDVYLDTVDGSTLVSDNQAGLTYTPTLAPGTTYYWKVVPANAFGDAVGCPVWSFMTPAADQVVESFENTAFPPAGWANTGSWYRGTTYYKHGTAGAYKSGSTTATYVLSTPKLTITPTSTLNFWAAGSSTTTSILQVVYSADRITWTQIGANIIPTTTYTMANYSIDLSSLAGNNYYLGFQNGAGAGTNYIDLVVGPAITPEAPGAPTLSAPADLATNVNENPTITWTAPTTGGVPTGYNLYMDTADGSTLYASGVSSPYAVPIALDYNTTYYWTVEAYNGAGTGPQAAVRSFTTRANPIVSAFPYVVNFDDLTTPALPLNWIASEAVAGASQHWKTTTTAPHGASAPHSAPNYAYLYCYLASTAYNPYYLTTPPISLGADAKRLTYWYWIGDDTVEEPLSVEISTDLATWTNLYTHSNTTNTLDWYQQVVSLSDYTNQTVYLRFSGVSSYSYSMTDLGLDDIVVEDIPTTAIFNLTPDVASWDFGPVPVNNAATKTFTISNTGGADLTFSSISVSGTYYSASPAFDLSPIPAGQSRDFTVQFIPTVDGGPYAGTFDISFSREARSIALSGSGYAPASLPLTEDWESGQGDWVIANGTQTNAWFIGTADP
ncbi:MAG: choice-of-anchor J domain-containing protein, partial [Candidatus Cloacimonetes bacterium]|nr:choice-of-anchor J domain-containing protein [Candidatus Cloacimonadota bacterium]